MTTFEDSDGKKHTGINPAQVHHLYRTLKQANPNLDDKQILGDVRAIVSDGVNLSDRSGGKMTPLQGIQNVMQGLVKKPTAGAEDTGTATQAPPVAQQTKKQKAPSVPGTFGTWQLKKQAEQGVPGAKEKYEEALRLREEAGYNDEEVGLPEWQQGQ